MDEIEHKRDIIQKSAEEIAKNELSNFEYKEIFRVLEEVFDAGYVQGEEDTHDNYKLGIY